MNRFGEDEQAGNYRRPINMQRRIKISGTELRRSDMAIQLRGDDIDGNEINYWIPFSEFDITRQLDDGTIEGTIPEWLARYKNLV